MMSKSSKRHSKLLSLIFILNCLSKTSVFGILMSTVINEKQKHLLFVCSFMKSTGKVLSLEIVGKGLSTGKN